MTGGAKPLLDVLAGKVPSRRPVWLMRQAGRYLPEYRQVRAEAGSFLDLCYRPELAAEVTLQPLRRFDLDAAILFADILLLPQGLGLELTFKENEGPQLSPITDMAGVAKLDPVRAGDVLAPVMETVKLVKAALPGHVALIGFCGAPWTVASYMIEGGGSEERLSARRAAMGGEPWFAALMERIISSSVDYLAAQVEAGVEAVQIFDSWAGDLSADQQAGLVVEPLRRIVAGLRARCGPVPVICFARGVGAGHVAVARETGANAVGIEQAVPAGWAAQQLVPVTPVQGNLDPLRLVLGGKQLQSAVRQLCAALPRHSHIFNLGHGVRQETPPDHVAELVAAVRAADGA